MVRASRAPHGSVRTILTILVALAAAATATAVDPSFRDTAPLTLAANPVQVLPVQVDLDGRLDLVALTDTTGVINSGRIVALLGAGDGTFTVGTQPRQQVGLGQGVSSMVAADVTGDGRTDLIVSAVTQTTAVPPAVPPPPQARVLLLAGDPQGGFGAPTLLPGIAATTTSPLIDVADANGDGKLDLVMIERPNSNLLLFTGDGLGHFTSTGVPIPLSGISRLVLADLNADRRSDVVVTTATTIGTLLADAAELDGFQSMTQYSPNVENITGISVVDVNQDGLLDAVASGSRAGAGIGLMLRGVGRGAFDPAPVPLALGAGPVLGRRQADLNGDGFVDPVATNTGSDPIGVLPSNFGAAFSKLLPVLPPANAVVPADLDGDSRSDLVMLNTFARQVTSLINITSFPPPGARTGPATEITTTSATLTGTVSPRLQGTTYFFEYGGITGYGARTPDVRINGGVFSVAAAAPLAGQFAGSTIHYRLVATNRFGTSPGADEVVATTGLVGDVRFVPRWRLSRQTGTLVIDGLPQLSGRMIAQIRDASGKVKLTKPVGLSVGKTRVRLQLPSALRPGSYQVVLSGPDPATGSSVTHLAARDLAAPIEGYGVAFMSRNDGGAPRRSVPRGVTTLWANYRFINEPGLTRRGVVQVCSGRTRILPAIRRYKKALTIAMSTRSSRPLAPGRYTCTLSTYDRRVKINPRTRLPIRRGTMVPVARATILVR